MAGPRVIWIVIALTCVAVTQGGVEYICARNEPREVRPLRHELTALPAQLGDWKIEETSVDSGMDPKVLNVLGADEAVTRSYKNSRGQHCSVHLAYWSAKNEWTPHPPDLCYDGAGFVRRQQKVEILPGSTEHSVRWSQYASLSGGTVVDAIYWYQIGDNTYYDRASARPTMRKLWGKPERPPLIKVLMQTSDVESTEARSSLKELAGGLEDHVAKL